MHSFPTLNKVTLIGYVLQKPQIKFLSDTNALCDFTIGTFDVISVNSNKEKKRITDYHTITCWNEFAKEIYKNISENQLIYIEGKLKHRKWTGKDGLLHDRAEIFLSSYLLLSENQLTDTVKNGVYTNEQSIQSSPLTGFESTELDNLPF
jgi:single-strand DNA-binding protein